MRRPPLAGFILMVLPLTGCETLGLTSRNPAAEAAVDVGGPPCPATAVLADAASVTKLKGPANPTNIMVSAEMSQARLDCDYNREANTLSVDITFQVRAMRGPAASGASPELAFFVAVVDADNSVVAKQVFQTLPDLGGKATNVYRQNVSKFAVPLARDKHPADYEVLTGFQLSPEELAYNRAPRALPAPRQTKP